jgi:DNA helicase-2/ATP-dependent DNA helicase PcrA
MKGRRLIASRLARLNVPKAAAEAWLGFVRLIREIRQDEDAWPGELRVVRKWYEPLLRYNYDDDPEKRLADVAKFEHIGATYDSRREFLTDLALDPQDETRNGKNGAPRDADYLVLSTIHSAKGQEWRAVRILNVTDGCIPLDRAEDIEEERRLLHVAMTRAKNELGLIFPQRHLGYQNRKLNGQTVCSRFIPPGIRASFQWRT